MRSTPTGASSPDPANAPDLTTRARIRDAAIVVFGEHGFRTGVRTIAAAAGVSPGLVIHHFGSKDGLREACDEQVLATIRAAKTESLTRPSAATLLHQLADVEEYAPLIAYLVRSWQTGGAMARSLFAHLVADVEQYLADGVAAGTIRPSRDPAARATYLALQSLGSTLLFLQIRTEEGGPADWPRAIRELTDVVMFPALEIYTEGLLTDSTFLDAVAGQRTDPGSPTPEHPDPAHPDQEHP
ncbi:TetR family transcriptional regulator [Rhodococcus sp. NPDC058505]|uniref:TetR/AcrR family transcriptional regulator n=1 Tax=unclassified Rhodococcus (in: high G+C Gram-positive bacteria) TaxID=192944 RepID=UPI00366417AF